MGRVENRSSLVTKLLNGIEDVLAGLWINANRWLIHHQKGGLVHQCDSHVDAALHPTLEFFYWFFAPVIESDEMQECLCPLLARFRGQAVNLAKELQVLQL